MIESTSPARKGPNAMPPARDSGISSTRLEVIMENSMPAASGSAPAVVIRLIRSQWKP